MKCDEMRHKKTSLKKFARSGWILTSFVNLKAYPTNFMSFFFKNFSDFFQPIVWFRFLPNFKNLFVVYNASYQSPIKNFQNLLGSVGRALPGL